MIIYCTESSNDADLVRALGSAAVRVPIAFGDACFFGVGESSPGVEIPIRVLVERKRISDMASCILGGRYLHQIQSARSVGFDQLCLVIEGEVRPSPDDGLVEVPYWQRVGGKLQHLWKPVVPAIVYSRFDQYLTELDYLAGVIVKRSLDVKETAAIVKALWQNFQAPPSKHSSLHVIYSQPSAQALLVRPNLVRRVAKELDGIGWQRSAEVAKRFCSVREMVEASAADWEQIKGIGKKTAQKAVSSLSGQQTNT